MNGRCRQRSRMIGRDAERAGIVLGIVVVDAVDDEQRLRKEQESEQHEQRGPPAPHLERRGEHRNRIARRSLHRSLDRNGHLRLPGPFDGEYPNGVPLR